MERLRTHGPEGLSRAGLRRWGMLFVVLGIFGRGILQARFLGTTDLNSDQLLAALTVDRNAMLIATVAVVLQFVETCAAPIFCLLLAEGFAHTSNSGKYLARVTGVALISELPYNFAMSGRLLDFGSRNPVFGIAMSLLVLYLYDRFAGKKLSNVMLKILFTLAAFLWCGMLKIESGACCVLITLAFWALRKKPMFRNLAAGGATMLCCFFSFYYMAAPMGMLAVHFYNGEKGEENSLVSYLFYPAALIVCGVAGYAIFGC